MASIMYDPDAKALYVKVGEGKIRKQYSIPCIEDSISGRKVTVLDCCYAGALGSIGLGRKKKGGEENALKVAAAIRNKIRSGKGTCILSACLDTQEAMETIKSSCMY